MTNTTQPDLTVEYTAQSASTGLPGAFKRLGIPQWATAWHDAPQGQTTPEVLRALEIVCADYDPDFITLSPRHCEELGPHEIDTIRLRCMLIDAYRIGYAHTASTHQQTPKFH